MHRINLFAVLIFILISGLAQAGSFDSISLFGIKPDLLLVIVIFFSLSLSKENSLKIAIIAGLIKDINSSVILGSYTISFLLIALFLNYHQNKFYKERVSTQALICFLSHCVAECMVLLFAQVSYKAPMFHYPFFNIIFKGALYTAFISPIAFFALSRVFKIDLAPSL